MSTTQTTYYKTINQFESSALTTWLLLATQKTSEEIQNDLELTEDGKWILEIILKMDYSEIAELAYEHIPFVSQARYLSEEKLPEALEKINSKCLINSYV